MTFLAPLNLSRLICSVMDGDCLHPLKMSLEVHRGLRMFQTSLHYVSLVTQSPQAAFAIMSNLVPLSVSVGYRCKIQSGRMHLLVCMCGSVCAHACARTSPFMYRSCP